MASQYITYITSLKSTLLDNLDTIRRWQLETNLSCAFPSKSNLGGDDIIIYLGLAKTWPWNFGPEQCWSKKTPFTFHHNLIDSNSTVSLLLVLKIVPGQNWGVFNLLKAEARLLCQRHVLCAAATFCATYQYHPLVSYFDVKIEEERD